MEDSSVNLEKGVEMAKNKKKSKKMLLFLQILRWLSLFLAILFFIWLAKNLGWIKI